VPPDAPASAAANRPVKQNAKNTVMNAKRRRMHDPFPFDPRTAPFLIDDETVQRSKDFG
jgi:hypothetical protein